MDFAKQYLAQHDIKPSMQRLAVMKYLLENRCHPTADDIFNALLSGMPTLSKTTVYNTLRLFTEKGAILAINIEDNVVHFDACTELHAHFQCLKCGRIVDIPIEENAVQGNNGLKGTLVTDTQVHYKGYCKDCLAKQKTENQENNIFNKQ